MKCSEYEKYGFLLQSDELTKEESSHFLQHIEKCSFCKNQLQNEKYLFDFINETKISPPECLHKNILAQIKKENRVFGFLSKRVVYTLSIAAATALLLFINTKLINKTDTQTDWQAESGIVALTEVASIEHQIALLDIDYRQSSSSVTNESEDESLDLYQSDDELSLIESLDYLE